MHTNVPAIHIIEIVRALLAEAGFLARHRTTPKAFTRQRKLPFNRVVLLVLQKTLKSLQLHLHEFFERLADGAPGSAATPGAWTQARAKLRHSAFIELNALAVLAPLEAVPEALARWQGHRLLAFDSSLLRLPASPEVWEHFGGQEAANQSGPCGVCIPPTGPEPAEGQARLSVLYDVLNRLGLDTALCGFATGEVALATGQPFRQAQGPEPAEGLGALHAGDLTLIDRGYAGCEFFAQIVARGAHFVGRCPRRSFAMVAELFAREEAGVSETVTLKAPASALAAGLPAQMQVRFVTVRLSTGELEVLATSLLNEERYPAGCFLELYGRGGGRDKRGSVDGRAQRWGIETYYGALKGRLELENFSGQTLEAILQDVHAAVFLSNLESVIAVEAAAALPKAGEDGRRHAVQINRAVSFHALKSRAIELLLGPAPVEEVLGELRALFLANPVSVRPHRRPPRRAPSPLRSHHFQKRVRKIVF